MLQKILLGTLIVVISLFGQISDAVSALTKKTNTTIIDFPEEKTAMLTAVQSPFEPDIDIVKLAEENELSIIEIWYREKIIEFVSSTAKDYGVNQDLAVFLVAGESQFEPDRVGDTHLICPRTGEIMRSRGLYQWNSCYWPEISDEEAFDVVSSTILAMEELKKGEERCKQLWTVCRRYEF